MCSVCLKCFRNFCQLLLNKIFDPQPFSVIVDCVSCFNLLVLLLPTALVSKWLHMVCRVCDARSLPVLSTIPALLIRRFKPSSAPIAISVVATAESMSPSIVASKGIIFTQLYFSAVAFRNFVSVAVGSLHPAKRNLGGLGWDRI